VSTTEPECAMRYSIVDAEIAECSSAPDMLDANQKLKIEIQELLARSQPLNLVIENTN
jgi:hypothetical protein